MAVCGHCGKSVKGIRDHIKEKHGYNFYCLGPDLHRYFGKNEPPMHQKDDLPDAPK